MSEVTEELEPKRSWNATKKIPDDLRNPTTNNISSVAPVKIDILYDKLASFPEKLVYVYVKTRHIIRSQKRSAHLDFGVNSASPRRGCI